jgi:hypothetical protein
MNANKNNRWSAGRIIISIVGLFTMISPYLADWNVTHIYNPTWPPHAKFHNAQTMVLGAFLGALTLYNIWLRKNLSEKQILNESTVLASLYWLAQLPAILFPGTKLVDPGTQSVVMPVVFGIQFNQLVMNITVLFPVLLLGYTIERRRLGRQRISKH